MNNQTILIGFYKGLGDFINIVPILIELNKNFKLYVLVSPTIFPFIEHFNLTNGITFISFDTVSSGSYAGQLKLFFKLLATKFDFFFIAPDPQSKNTSRLIPIFARLLKIFKGKNSFVIVGSVFDRLSNFYDLRLPVSKLIPLLERNLQLFSLTNFLPSGFIPNLNIFKKLDCSPVKYDVVIHPGASSINRTLPLEYLESIVKCLTSKNLKIVLIGRDDDLKPYADMSTSVEFFSGPLSSMLSLIKGSRLIITMDSGFSHVASMLGMHHIVLMGPGDVRATPPSGVNSYVIHTKQQLECMPCNSNRCFRGSNVCLTTISPSQILNAVDLALNR